MSEVGMIDALWIVLATGLVFFMQAGFAAFEAGMVKENNAAVIRIKDNGCGMPEEIGKRIFTPSFSTKNSGMGLGLAITKQIIETAGGSIDFTSSEDQGTEFVISLSLN